LNAAAPRRRVAMPEANAGRSVQQSARFMYLYALAVSGGSVAYIPFLTILLPVRATALSGNNALNILAIIAFVGAIAASVANISFGWASDKTKTRHIWIWSGLAISSTLMLAMPWITHTYEMIITIIFWQIGLNMMLAPLAAWAGDNIPDSQKGMLGGLLALAPALGALSGAFVTLQDFIPVDRREMVVAILVVIMVAPVLLFGKPTPMAHLMRVSDTEAGRADAARNTAIRMWLARLLVQIAEASLFAFLLIWFRSLDPDFGENDAAAIFAIVLSAAVFLALIIGRWSDYAKRPILPLIWGSGIAGIGLVMMAFAPSLPFAIAGYAAFGLASSIFLALHSSQTLRVLPRPHTRGRDLGIFNLTNTVPSLIMPWLTVALVPAYGFDSLFLLLAGFAAAASLLLMGMPRTVEHN
jgi:MFS family permease